MKKLTKQDIPVLITYAIPLYFWAMYGDINWNNLLLYPVMLVDIILLNHASLKKGNLLLLLVGNIVCALSNTLFINLFGTEKWSYYFTLIYSPIPVLFFICVIQIIVFEILKYSQNK